MSNWYEKFKIPAAADKYENPDPETLQHPYNVMILGKTGSGKTNFLMDLIFGRYQGGSAFEKVSVFLGKKSDDPLYRRAKDLLGARFTIYDLEEFPEWFNKREQEFFEVGERSDLLDQHLVVLDDFLVVSDVGTQIETFGTMSRKWNCSCAYLTQSFTPTPKPIRGQITAFVLMRNIHREQLLLVFKFLSAINISKERFIALYQQATGAAKLTDWMLVDLNSRTPALSIRKGWETPLLTATDSTVVAADPPRQPAQARAAASAGKKKRAK